MSQDYSDLIRVEGANVFLGGNHIIKDLNWALPAGQHSFILGANGAGKTTLVKMLMGYAWPIFGAKIQLFGETFGEVDLVQLRKRIAWVSPFMQQWTGQDWTGLEMVISGLDGTLGLFRDFTEAEEEQALTVMRRLRCEKLRDRKLHVMSSGEQVKILIARALMCKPKLMILDEASVYLDITSREFLLDTVTHLAGEDNGMTILFITQRIEDIVPVFKHGMILANGEIVARGAIDDVLTEDNLEKAFQLKIKLIQNSTGRYWPVIE